MAFATIVGFHQDEDGTWIVELSCGHRQHMRHDPPWQNRPWVLTADGRARFVGIQIPCTQCDRRDDHLSRPIPENIG